MERKEIFNWYVAHGLSEAGAAGMAANIEKESRNDSRNLQNSYEKKLGYTDETYTKAVDSGKYTKFASDRAGYGFCQWTSAGRKKGLLEYAKKKDKSIGDPIMQLEYSLREMSRSLKGVLCSIKDPFEAGRQVMLKFERPANQTEANQRIRGNLAVTIYNECSVKKSEDEKKEDLSVKIIRHYLKKNRCYIAGAKIKPNGSLVHSTGCNNKNVTRYVDDESLGKVSSNHWNSSSKTLSKCVHAVIGWSEKLKKVVVVETLPYDMRSWGCGSGSKGSYNGSKIQFEICEGSATDKTYFEEAYNTAVEYCAYLCKKYGWTAKNITSHVEAHAKGYASNHGDPVSYFKKFGKTMDQFRKDVTSCLASPKTDSSEEFQSYKVKVTAKELGVYKSADSKSSKVLTVTKGDVYTIVEEKNGWGKLKSGAGWILLKSTSKV